MGVTLNLCNHESAKIPNPAAGAGKECCSAHATAISAAAKGRRSNYSQDISCLDRPLSSWYRPVRVGTGRTRFRDSQKATMRFVPLILVVFVPMSSGCSALIAFSGKDLGKFESRDQVYKKFGPPTTATTEDGTVIESYHTRQKICDNSIRTASLGMGIAMTYGLGEAYYFPREFFILTQRTVFGQTIRFAYDDAGNVKYATLDGQIVPYNRRLVADREKKQATSPPQSGSVNSP